MRELNDGVLKGSMSECMMELEMVGMKSHPNGSWVRRKLTGVRLGEMTVKMKELMCDEGRRNDQ
jgi:hypothetical protein